ncbi:hypothetical protein INT48_009750 [Thamnidium elegans]|uniref:Uncharacterized protein n=1 Tax=Thamnidium elegans TaxID=101142 RepID=A0A8H7STA9_9FUNG|nr:hypothetical protein INT48_009750 [Thamnidium elegans]
MNTNATQPAASLKQILERSKLTNSKILPQELPSIERGLDQIDSQSKKLSSKTASNDEGGNIRAHYFLAQGGVNTQELITDLGTIHLGGLEEHRQPIQDMDVEGYLEQQRTETVLKIIEDGRHEIVDYTKDSFDNTVDAYWKDLTNNQLKVNQADTSTLNLSKAKFDTTKVVGAGIVI